MAKKRRRYSSKKYRGFKKKKSIFKNRFFWFFILGIIILSGFFYLFIFSSVFRLREVKVQGVYFIDALKVKEGVEKRIERDILFFPSESIFILDKREIRNFVLEEFFPAKEVVVKKKLPNKLLINIRERQAQAIACAEECFFIDAQGFAFQLFEKETMLRILPLIRFEEEIAQRDKLVEQETLRFVSLIYSRLRQREKLVIQEFRISSLKVEAKTKEGLRIYFCLEKSFYLQIEDLILLLGDEVLPEIAELEYIDLRFNKIFFK